MQKFIFTAILATALVITTVSPALAISVPDVLKERREELKQEIQEKRENLREEIRGRIASQPGILKLFASGRIAIGSGEISAISGTTLTVKKDDKTYTVLIDNSTELRRKYWGESSLTEFSVGDKVNVVGIWQDDVKTTIKAQMIRDVSIQKRHGVFFGKITATSESGFTMDTQKRGVQTVTVNNETDYTDRTSKDITKTDIAIGHKVRVRGLWDTVTTTISEVTHIKDFSLPAVSASGGADINVTVE